MVGIVKQTQHANRGVYRFVPLQDFSKPWTDEELYKKYNLSEEEIKFIEDNIAPMEDK
jgi:site-specific DNA-methyltransferase (adenine-specific)